MLIIAYNDRSISMLKSNCLNLGEPQLNYVKFRSIRHIRVSTFTAIIRNLLPNHLFDMKKNVIIFVIVIITISLLGLIGIQLYWISNALSVKESNFQQGCK
jgi:hypothetical protein